MWRVLLITFVPLQCQQGKPSGQVNVTFGREELFDADPMVCPASLYS